MALTTLATVKTLLGVASSDDSQDALLTILIAGVGPMIERSLKRKLDQDTFTEYYSGDGTPFLVLNQRPVHSIASLYVSEDGHFGDGTFTTAGLLVAGTDYALMRTSTETESSLSGIVRRIGGVWPVATIREAGMLVAAPVGGSGNIKITYTAGYASVPPDLALAAAQLVARIKTSLSVGGGVQSMSYEDAAVTYLEQAEASGMIGSIESVLRSYRSYVV